MLCSYYCRNKLDSCFAPSGAFENSPAIHCWESYEKICISPVGTTEAPSIVPTGLPWLVGVGSQRFIVGLFSGVPRGRKRSQAFTVPFPCVTSVLKICSYHRWFAPINSRKSRTRTWKRLLTRRQKNLYNGDYAG